ncbi:hypothetical protein F4806DRAFT_449819 [Annulohypoxylon nitens]|nr:hypothetical protein F4806DRAFT_449819 [Annulohypoxylon nitens]
MQLVHWSVVALCSVKYAVGLRIPPVPQVTETPTIPTIQQTTAAAIQQRGCLSVDPEILGGTAGCVSLAGPLVEPIPTTTQDFKLARDASTITSTVQTIPQCTSIRINRDGPPDEITFTCSGCDGFAADEIIDFVLLGV